MSKFSKAVNSSCIRAVTYDRIERELIVEFTHGGEYTYWEVPEVLVEELLRADSAGRFYNENIRGQFLGVNHG